MTARTDLAQAMRLYAITDRTYDALRPLPLAVKQAIQGGATCIQLRDKHALPTTESDARAVADLCRYAGIPFIVNDDVALACRVDADGVHVGQDDTSCAEARAALGSDKIIGVSVHTVEEAKQAEAQGADYVGVGALFATPTKPDAHVVAPEELKAITETLSIPVVAIGGLNLDTLDTLEYSGVDGAAVVSAVFGADDVADATMRLRRKVEQVLGRRPSVVTIAGSDSSGGAGIQADLKTMEANSVFGQSALAALTAQNTLGVTDVFNVPPEFVTAQVRAIFADIVPDAVKIGMLSDARVVRAVAQTLQEVQTRNVVLDPVMVATSGAELSTTAAVQAMVETLFPLAVVITPNLSEARVLAGCVIDTKSDMEHAARLILDKGVRAVLIKGGHLKGCADDLLMTKAGETYWFEGEIIETKDTHGTGCSLSSAIASYLAKGYALPFAVEQAKAYVAGALCHDIHLGKGSGPLNHSWRWD